MSPMAHPCHLPWLQHCLLGGGGGTAPRGPTLPRGDTATPSTLHAKPGGFSCPRCLSPPWGGHGHPRHPLPQPQGMQLPRHPLPTTVGCLEGGGGGGLLLPNPNLPLTTAFPARLGLAVRAHGVQRPRGGGLHDVILVKDGGARPWCRRFCLRPHCTPALSPGRAVPAAWPAWVPQAARRLSPCPSTSYTSHALGHGTCHPSLALRHVTHPLSPALSHGKCP